MSQKTQPVTTPPSVVPHRVRVEFRVNGLTEGDNHRAKVAIAALGHILCTDPDVQEMFKRLGKRHAAFRKQDLGEYDHPIHEEARTAFKTLVEARLGGSYEVLAVWLYVLFLTYIIAPAGARCDIGWMTEPIPEHLSQYLSLLPQLRSESPEQYMVRIKAFRPSPIKKGRKPRNAGLDLAQYAQWFYSFKWTKSISQRRLARDYAEARRNYGNSDNQRSHIRNGVAEIDGLLKLIALPVRILVSP